MFPLASDQDIGQYLVKLITEKHHTSLRQFGRECLRFYHEEPDEYAVDKMANRLNAITKGKKSIQLKDLPVFCELLDISCEELLSAGKSASKVIARTTNYDIAYSENREKWDRYIAREDKPILYADEFGKTVIDYALQAGNYPFLKHLVTKGYIWFDSRNENDYFYTFGAGTSINDTRRFLPPDIRHALYEDQLRLEMIAIAAKNSDIEMLDLLRAREHPDMYDPSQISPLVSSKMKVCADSMLISSIAASEDAVIDYFTDEFSVHDRIRYKDGIDRNHFFMFMAISSLLEALAESNHPMADAAMIKAIRHNKKVYEFLKDAIDSEISVLLERSGICADMMRNTITAEAAPRFCYKEDSDLIAFPDSTKHGNILTNIAHVEAASNEPLVREHINELNEWHRKILHISDEYREVKA